SPDHSYIDEPYELRMANGNSWAPIDTRGYSGLPMSLRDGLALSKNTITAQVGQAVGAPAIVRIARAAGIEQSKLDAVPSLALGTSPVTLLEMSSAYATIANLGVYRKPMLVRRIRDRNGAVLADFPGTGRDAMSQESARDLIDM